MKFKKLKVSMRLLISLVLIALCSCGSDKPADPISNVSDMSDAATSDAGTDISLDLAPATIPQGECKIAEDCGPAADCSDGFCVRLDDNDHGTGFQCNGGFFEPPGQACEVHPVTGDIKTLTRGECSDDSQCEDSLFGPRCLFSACTVLVECDENDQCPEPQQTCREDYRVCFPATPR